jgi:glycosyltransferase involved in cell wall biosynthesis
MPRKVPIVHVINSFQFGGAEAMLCNLLLRTDRERFEPSVVTLIDDMSVAAPVVSANIPITCVNMRPGIPDPRGVLRLAQHLKRARPAVVQTWMDHSNLIGGLAARMAIDAPVVWGVHHSNHVKGVAKRSTLLTVAACAKLSRRIPARIVVCSEVSKSSYTASGFSADRMTVIPNGFDTKRFQPDSEARRSIRAELGLPADCFVFGLAARFDPMKDPMAFLRAAAIVARRFNGVRFVVCGKDMDNANAELVRHVRELGLADRLLLIGPRRDVPRLLAAVDVAALSSISEAFPLVLGEAMACGTPCVSTDVGDAARIIGDTGRIVPPSNPQAMADAMAAFIMMPEAKRVALGTAGRKRVCEMFDLDAVTRRYEAVYEDVISRRDAGATMPVEQTYDEAAVTAAG